MELYLKGMDSACQQAVSQAAARAKALFPGACQLVTSIRLDNTKMGNSIRAALSRFSDMPFPHYEILLSRWFFRNSDALQWLIQKENLRMQQLIDSLFPAAGPRSLEVDDTSAGIPAAFRLAYKYVFHEFIHSTEPFFLAAVRPVSARISASMGLYRNHCLNSRNRICRFYITQRIPASHRRLLTGISDPIYKNTYYEMYPQAFELQADLELLPHRTLEQETLLSRLRPVTENYIQLIPETLPSVIRRSFPSLLN